MTALLKPSGMLPVEAFVAEGHPWSVLRRMRKDRRLVSKSRFARVDSLESAPAKSMTDDELRAENAAYVGALAQFVGAELATRIFDEYLKQIHDATKEADRRGDVDRDVQITRLG